MELIGPGTESLATHQRRLGPLPALTSAQKVELFRIVTGADYKDMLAFGVYAFYRVGIGFSPR